MFFSYLNQQSDCTTNRHTKLDNSTKKRRTCYLIYCSLIYPKNKFTGFLKCSPHSIKLVSQNKAPHGINLKCFTRILQNIVKLCSLIHQSHQIP